MKIFQKMLFVAAMFVVTIATVNAQKGTKWAEISIQTSGQCEMCQERIEKVMAYEKGIKSFSYNADTKVLKVTYNTKKTTDANIRTAINKAGYDADNQPADPIAYKNLPACCQKPKE